MVDKKSDELSDRDRRVLSSWKEIANYLGKSISAVQRWEKHLALPVHRIPQKGGKSAVVAYADELDAWIQEHKKLNESSLGAPLETTAVSTDASRADERRRWGTKPGDRLLAFVAAAVSIAFAAVAVVWVWSSRADEPIAWEEAPFELAPPYSQRRVAVIPLQVLGGDEDTQFLSSALTTDLRRELSFVPGVSAVQVINEEERGTRAAAEIRREFKVGSVLSGDIRQAGDSVTVNLQLLDSASGAVRWAEAYRRNEDDVFELLDGVAKSVAESLDIELAIRPRSARWAEYRRSAVYPTFAAGLALTRQRGVDNFAKAKNMFDRAIEADPDFAPAYSALASTVPMDLLPRDEVLSQMEPLVEEALSRDPGLAHAHSQRGDLLWAYHYNYAEAREHYLEALRLDPDESSIRVSYCSYLLAVGNANEAIRHARVGVDLTPEMIDGHALLGDAYYFAGRQSDAEASYRQALEINPDSIFVLWRQGRLRAAQGHFEEAREIFAHCVEAANGHPLMVGLVGYAEANLGHISRARERLQAIKAAETNGHLWPFTRFMVEQALGEHEQAFASLAEAFEVGPVVPVWSDPMFAGIHTDPRLREFETRYGPAQHQTQ